MLLSFGIVVCLLDFGCRRPVAAAVQRLPGYDEVAVVVDRLHSALLTVKIVDQLQFQGPFHQGQSRSRRRRCAWPWAVSRPLVRLEAADLKASEGNYHVAVYVAASVTVAVVAMDGEIFGSVLS